MQYQSHKELVKKFMSKNSITVYTPREKAVSLPKGSTALDFAFAIHGDLCLYAKDAEIVDAKGTKGIRRIDHVLKSGDIIRIRTVEPDPETGKRTVQASLRWITVANNPNTKRFIEKHFSTAMYGDNAECESTANEKRFLKAAAELVRLNPKLTKID